MKNFKNIYMLFAMVAILIGTTTNAAYAQEIKIRHNRPYLNNDMIGKDAVKVRPAKHGNRMGVSNLTEEQKAKIKDISLSEQKQSLQLRNQLGEKRAKLRSLESADKADLKDINKLIDEIAKIQAESMKLKAGNKQKVRALLNDEQRIEFDTKRNSMNGNRMDMRVHRNMAPHAQLLDSDSETHSLFDFDIVEFAIVDVNTEED